MQTMLLQKNFFGGGGCGWGLNKVYYGNVKVANVLMPISMYTRRALPSQKIAFFGGKRRLYQATARVRL